MRLGLFAGLVTAILLNACGGAAFLSPEPEPQVILRSAANGQTVVATDPIVFAVAGAGAVQPERVTVEVLTAEGAVAGVTSIDHPAADTDLSLDLSFLAGQPGQYQARFTLRSADAVLDEKSLVFFVAPGVTRVNGIESRPSIIYAGATVDLSVELASTVGSDPFLRWTANGRPFAAGLASQGGSSVTWTAPRDPGVYTIGVEVFPVAPSEGSGFAYPSSVRTNTELYVTESRRGGGLGPAASYWMLYGLDGTLRDATRTTVEAEAVGTIEPAASGENVGYRIMPPWGLRIPRSIVPPDGARAGFTVSIGLTPTEVRPGARILYSGRGPRTLSIVVGADRSPEARLKSESGEITLPSGLAALAGGDSSQIDLTFVPNGTGGVFMWFLDGEPGAVNVLDSAPVFPGPDGETLVGGPGGLPAIVDELGVYARGADGKPGPDPGIFARAMRSIHGDALLLADGFDGTRLDSAYKVVGDAVVSLGRLVLAPGASIEVALPRPNGSEIVLETVADRQLLAGWQGRTLRLAAGPALRAEERTRVRIVPRENDTSEAGGYRLAVYNGGDGPLSVASLLGYVD
jgi:hypothetical protein